MTDTKSPTHLIALTAEGLLMGTVLISEFGRLRLEDEVRREVAMIGGEADADAIWSSCSVYSVRLLSKAEADEVEADDDLSAAMPGPCVYSGTSMGHLLDGAWAAYGRLA